MQNTIPLKDYLATLPNGQLQIGSKTPNLNNGILQNVDVQQSINNRAQKPTNVIFTNSNIITIDHNLGYKPIVSILDSTDAVIEANVQHTNLNQFVVNFSSNTYLSGTIQYV